MAKAEFEPNTRSLAVQRFNHWATTALNMIKNCYIKCQKHFSRHFYHQHVNFFFDLLSQIGYPSADALHVFCLLPVEKGVYFILKKASLYM